MTTELTFRAPSEEIPRLIEGGLYFPITAANECILVDDGVFRYICLFTIPDVLDYFDLGDEDPSNYAIQKLDCKEMATKLLDYCLLHDVVYVMIDGDRYEADIFNHYLKTGTVQKFGRLARA